MGLGWDDMTVYNESNEISGQTDPLETLVSIVKL